jgi:hypothetical protein
VDHVAQREAEKRRLEEEAAQAEEPAPEVPSGL